MEIYNKKIGLGPCSHLVLSTCSKQDWDIAAIVLSTCRKQDWKPVATSTGNFQKGGLETCRNSIEYLQKEDQKPFKMVWGTCRKGNGNLQKKIGLEYQIGWKSREKALGTCKKKECKPVGNQSGKLQKQYLVPVEKKNGNLQQIVPVEKRTFF